MARAVFNKAGNLSFTVTSGHDASPVTPYAIVSARLYTDAPSDAQREDSAYALADALQHVTSWSTGRNDAEKLIAYTAIEDTDPTSAEDFEILYWVVSYRLENGGEIINDVEPFTVWRTEAVQARFDVTKRDLIAVEGKLENLVGAMTLADKIALAERLVVQDLRSKSLDVTRLDQGDAKDLVRYRALVLCCTDLSKEPNDSWMAKATRYEKYYETLRDGLALGYDGDDDGDIEPGEEDDGAIFASGFFSR